MKKFRFRLERVLDARRVMEQEAQKDFAAASRRLNERREQLAEALREVEQAEQEQRRVRSGKFRALDAMIGAAQDRAVRERAKSSEGLVKESSRMLDGQRKILTSAMQARQTLETLKERRLEEYNLNAGRSEQGIMDDDALRRFIHSNKNVDDGEEKT